MTLAGRFAAEIQAILDQRDPSFSSRLYRYLGDYPARAEQYIRYHQDLLGLAGISVAGERVLDVGCGFAPALILYALMGASELHGVELNESMVASVHAYGTRIPLQVVHGSASELPLADCSIDLITSNEAISHYLDVDGFIREAHRVLAPGGTVIIADSNNGANPKIRRENLKLWEDFETSFRPASAPGATDEGFALMRQEIAVENGVPAGVAHDFALLTAGMTRKEVVAAAERYLEAGVMPSSHYKRGAVAVNPNLGLVLERMFDPRALARKFAAGGFDARAFGYWGGASGSPALRAANRMLQRLPLVVVKTAPSFRIVGRRSNVTQ